MKRNIYQMFAHDNVSVHSIDQKTYTKKRNLKVFRKICQLKNVNGTKMK